MEKSSRSNTVTIGINLGTSDVSASVWRNGKIDVIPNFHDQSGVTPCFISFKDTGSQIGFPALNQVEMSPANTIFDAKRLLGRKWDDPKIQHDLQYWPYKLIKNGDNPEFEVTLMLETRHLLPEKVISLLLKHIKELVENYLGDPTVTVFYAVVAVPATFNYFQRQAIRELGAWAGLNVLRTVNDNIATAVTYGHLTLSQDKDSNRQQKPEDDHKSLLIFDFGAGFLSVSIFTMEKGVYVVKATSGDSHLGGRDFDNRLFQHFSQKFKNNKSLKEDPKAFVRFLGKCEEMKIILSSKHESCFNYIDVGDSSITFSSRITRPQFEEICTDLLDAALLPVKKILVDAKMEKSQIHDVILVGGSSKIPKVQGMLQNFFEGKLLIKLIDSHGTVAYGAAMQAAILSGYGNQNLEELLVVDVAPVSLGVGTSVGVMSVFIKRNSAIPIKQTQSFVANSFDTAVVNSNSQSICHPVVIRVYEGERTLVKDNNLLYTLNFNAATPASEIELTFDIDHNNILSVTAVDKSAGNNEEITVRLDRSQLLGVAGSGSPRVRESVGSSVSSVSGSSVPPRASSSDNRRRKSSPSSNVTFKADVINKNKR